MKLRKLLSLAALSLSTTFPAFAQPTEPWQNEGQNLSLDQANGNMTYEWWGKSGRTYFIQSSENLVDWTYIPIIEPGIGDWVEWGFSMNGDKLFLRLEFTDLATTNAQTADFDGDRVDNLTEIMNGTDFFGGFFDSDGDGLSDDWEIAFGSQDGSLDLDGDGFTAYQEQLAGTSDDPTQDGASSFPIAPFVFAVVDLGRTSDVDYPVAVANAGKVLLSSGWFGRAHRWSPENGLEELNIDEGVALDMNNEGLVVGAVLNHEYGGADRWYYSDGTETVAAYWPSDSTEPVLIDQKTEWGISHIDLVNDSGDFIGYRRDENLGNWTVTWKGNVSSGWTELFDDVVGVSVARYYPDQDPDYWDYGWRFRLRGTRYYPFDLSNSGLAAGETREYVTPDFITILDSGDSFYGDTGESYTGMDSRDILGDSVGTEQVDFQPRLITDDDTVFGERDDQIGWYADGEFYPLPSTNSLWGVNSPDAIDQPQTILTSSKVFLQKPDGTGDYSALNADTEFTSWEPEQLISLPNADHPDIAQWIDVSIYEVSDNGLFMAATATNRETDERHSLLLVGLSQRITVKDLSTDEIFDAGGVVPESNPVPELAIEIDDATIASNGDLIIDLTADFRDPLSELGGFSRLGEAVIKINGVPHETISNLESMASGSFDPDWQTYDSSASITRQITISPPHRRSYVVSIEAGPNAAGKTGRAAVAVALKQVPAAQQPAAPGIPATVVFTTSPDQATVDSVLIYNGDRAPLPSDLAATESGQDSLVFDGSMEINGQVRATRFWMIADASPTFDPNAPDDFRGGMTYLDDSGTEIDVCMDWTETGNNTLRFFPSSYVVREPVMVTVVDSISPLEGTGKGHVLPYMVSIENSHALPEIFSDQSTDFSLSLNGQAISTVEYLPSGIPQDRKPEYFVAEGSVPKVFLNDASGLLPVPQGTDPGPLEIGLVWSQATEPFATSTVYLQTGEFAAAPMMAMAQGASAPADPNAEWEEQVLLFFGLLTGELGEEYLEAFTHEGGTWRHDSLGWFDFDGYEANHAYFSWKGPPEVVIERDQTPPEAALCLFEGLHQHIIWNRAVRAEYYEVTQWDPQKYADLQQELFQTAAQTTAVMAEAYLAGFSMVAEPLDYVFILNDVSQGEYLSIVAAAPFLSVQAVKYGKAVEIRLPSGLIRLNEEATEALAEAWQATTRLHRMDILGPKIADGTIDRNTVLALYDSGFLKARSRPSGLLRKDLSRVGKGTDPEGMIAHHDLPVEFEREFIAAGIDPNHGDNGRWVQKRIHDSWSNLSRFDGGGPYNQVWREFFDANQAPTATQILSLRDQIRSGQVFYPANLDGISTQGFNFD